MALALGAVPASGGIRTDGSTGKAVTLKGPNYLIGSGLGTLAGSNLFLSFSYFDLANGQSATFAGPSSLANIIARVTDGSPSAIDGKITGGTPSLYFINPAGIMFGPNASLNVEGSFHASTADYLQFADGAKFTAHLAAGSSFTMAAPVAFGFLSASPAALSADRANISVNAGQQLSLSGGGLTLQNASLTARGGAVSLNSVAGPGTIPVTPGAPAFATPPGGNVEVTGSTVSVDASASARQGGSLYIQGGNIVIGNGSMVSAANASARPGGIISVVGTGSVTITNGSTVSQENSGTGTGGTIAIMSAGDMTMAGGSAINAINKGTGQGSTICLFLTGSLQIQSGSGIHADSYGGGSAGNILIADPTGSISLSGFRYGSVSEVTSRSLNYTSSQSGGTAGNIKIEAASLSLSYGRISTFGDSSSTGAGSITVDLSQSLSMSNSSTIGSVFDGIGGTPSSITVQGLSSPAVPTVSLASQSTISTATDGPGPGGALTIVAGSINLAGGSSLSSSSGIKGQPGGNAAGPSGDVTIKASELSLTGSSIATNSQIGGGGTVDISVSGFLSLRASQVTTEVQGGDQNAGNVTIGAETLLLDNASLISANAFAGRGGNIRINVRDLLASADSSITASSAKGINGTVAVQAMVSDITAGIAPLSGKLVIGDDLSRLACDSADRGRNKQSTLVLHGRGQLPTDGQGALDLPYGSGAAWVGRVPQAPLPTIPLPNRKTLRGMAPCG